MQRRLDGAYVSTDRPILSVFALLLFAATLIFGAWRRYEIHGFDALFFVIVVLFALAVVGSLTLPTIQFSFDPARKIIVWTSQSFTKRDGGRLDFSDVRNVVLQATSGDDSPLTYRVALSTKDKTLPLSCSYSGNRAGVERLAIEIRGLLGMPADTLVRDSIAAMDAAGKTIDARSMQRELEK